MVQVCILATIEAALFGMHFHADSDSFGTAVDGCQKLWGVEETGSLLFDWLLIFQRMKKWRSIRCSSDMNKEVLIIIRVLRGFSSWLVALYLIHWRSTTP